MSYPQSELLPEYYQPYEQYNPFEGMPGGIAGNIVGATVGEYLKTKGVQSVGYNYNRGMYESLQRQAYDKQRSESLSMSKSMEAANYASTMMGASRMLGFDDDPARKKAFTDFASTALDWAPSSVSASRVADLISGGRSAYVLGGRISDVGRSVVDPVTGRQGFSPTTSAEISKNVFNRFFGPGTTPQDTSGLSTNDMGELTGELQRRGMLYARGSKQDEYSRALGSLSDPTSSSYNMEEYRGIQSRTGINFGALPRDVNGTSQLTSAQMDKLGDDKSVQNIVRTNAAKRIGDQLKDYSGAMAAVKELFGTPDAPIPVLFAQLEQLTGNSVQQLGGARSAATVRNMMNFAKNNNIGVEGLISLAQYSGELAQRSGLNSAFMPDITMGGMAMREFMVNNGSMATPAWGLSSIEQQTRIGQQRYAGAAGSKMANRAGLLMRLSERDGALGGKAADWANRIKGGGGVDDQMRTMSDAEFASMVADGSGGTLDRGTVSSMVSQNSTNSEFIKKYDVTDSVMTSGQRAEMRERFFSGSQGTFYDSAANFVRARTGGKGSKTITSALAASAGAALQGMNPENLANDDKRYGGMAKAMQDSLSATAEGRAFLSSMGNEEQQMRALSAKATDMWGSYERDLRASGFAGSGIDALLQTGPGAAAGVARAKQRVTTTSMLQQALSGTYDASALRRTFRAFRDEADKSGPGGEARMLEAVIGAESSESMRAKLLPQLAELDKLVTKFEGKDSAGGEKITEEEQAVLDGKKQGITDVQEEIRQIMKDNKLDPKSGEGDSVSPTAESGKAGTAGGPITMTGPISINIDGVAFATGASASVVMSGAGRGVTPTAGTA